MCYAFAPTATYPLPIGDSGSTGTCLKTGTIRGDIADSSRESQFYLGHGLYDAPATFFSGAFTYAPSKYFRFNGGARLTDTNGGAEFLNPLMVPGALNSKLYRPSAIW